MVADGSESEESQLDFDVVRDDSADVPLLRLSGELDMAAATTMRDEFLLVSRESPPAVVLDLAELRFLDSTGTSMLLFAFRRLHEVGAELRLAAPSKAVLRTLQTMGLDQVLSIFGDVDEALSSPIERHTKG